MKKLILIIIFVTTSNYNTQAKDKMPSIKETCNIVQYEIRNLELQKKNLLGTFTLHH